MGNNLANYAFVVGEKISVCSTFEYTVIMIGLQDGKTFYQALENLSDLDTFTVVSEADYPSTWSDEINEKVASICDRLKRQPNLHEWDTLTAQMSPSEGHRRLGHRRPGWKPSNDIRRRREGFHHSHNRESGYQN